jgi:hypothetical protein
MAYCLWLAFSRRTIVYVFLSLILLFPFHARRTREAYTGGSGVPPLVLSSPLVSRESALPVVVQDNKFLRAYHYAPPELRRRLLLLAGEAGHDPLGEDMMRLASYVPIHVVPYAEFVSSYKRSILEIGDMPFDLVEKLIKDGAQVELRELGGRRRIYLVTIPADFQTQAGRRGHRSGPTLREANPPL